MNPIKVLLLPGWLDSDPDHWQSRWGRLHGYERVVQHDWEHPLRGDWITRLEEVVLAQPPDQAIVLAAHSLGCHLVAAWAAVSRSAPRVHGALLVAPPDVSREDFPAQMHSWRQPVLSALPMAATCVVSRNDPFSSAQAGRALAQAWGARCVQAGPLGHINAASHIADWPQGHALLLDLVAQATPSPANPCRPGIATPTP